MSKAEGASRSRNLMPLIVGVIAVGLIASMILPQVTDPRPRKRGEPDSFSDHGLGHSLLADTLAGAGYEVKTLRQKPRLEIEPRSLVILAEPRVDDWDEAQEILDEVFRAGGTVLLALPKRKLLVGFGGEIVGARFLSADEVLDVANAFLGEDPVFEDWADIPSITRIDIKRLGPRVRPEVWTTPNRLEDPVIQDTQLIKASGLHMTPIVWNAQGILVGQISSPGRILVLSDPDLIANHGYGSSEANAALTHEIISYVAGGHTTIYFDEIIHGHGFDQDFWDQLFDYPLNLILIHGLLVLFILIWIATLRFGPAKRSPPPQKAGTEFLVDHVTSVILQGKEQSYLLSRYIDDNIRDVAHQLHLDQGSMAQIEERLAERCKKRQIAFEPRVWRLASRHKRGRLEAVALEVHLWKKEMGHGSTSDSRARRRRS